FGVIVVLLSNRRQHTKTKRDWSSDVCSPDLTELNEEKGQALATEFGDQGLFVKQDVTNEEDWKHVISEAEKAFGQIDVLVNNAGITMAKSILDVTEEEYRRIININQVSVFLGAKHVIPAMKKAGGGQSSTFHR